MPISKSAKKALRVSERKTEVNRRRKTVLKTAIKAASAETLSATFSVIDKAAKWGIIEKNRAARLKSRFGKQFETKTAIKPRPTAAAAPTKKTAATKKAVTTKKAAAPKKTAASKK
jgi:small subunit ribosomal protein S20